MSSYFRKIWWVSWILSVQECNLGLGDGSVVKSAFSSRSTQIVANKHLWSQGFDGLFGSPGTRHAHSAETYMKVEYPYTQGLKQAECFVSFALWRLLSAQLSHLFLFSCALVPNPVQMRNCWKGSSRFAFYTPFSLLFFFFFLLEGRSDITPPPHSCLLESLFSL